MPETGFDRVWPLIERLMDTFDDWLMATVALSGGLSLSETTHALAFAAGHAMARLYREAERAGPMPVAWERYEGEMLDLLREALAQARTESLGHGEEPPA
jgi:hypothetical protein